MYKIELEPTYEYTLLQGQGNWSYAVRDHVRPTYYTEEMIEWLFKNVTGKTIQDGKYLYFENDEDALVFKLMFS